jgi:hypothetical protein
MFNVSFVPELPNPAIITKDIGVAWKGRYYLTYKRGRNTTYYLPEAWKFEIERARQVTAQVIGIDPIEVKPTYSAMARQINEFIGIRDAPLVECSIPKLLPVWHYQSCIPTKCTSGLAIYDMRSAYWQIASKSDTLRVRIFEDGRVLSGYMSPREQAKWDSVREVCGQIKPLRLSIIGVNSAGLFKGSQSYSYWYRGKRIAPTGEVPTWFQPLSTLTVRIAYELTQIQANWQDCVYANADAVSVPAGERPEVWDFLGIQTAVKGEGTADIRAVGNYRIGGLATKTFTPETAPRYTPATQVDPLYYKVFFREVIL